MEQENLIRKIVWSFHRTSGIDWEELFAEASLAYCYALKTYDPERGSFASWLSGFVNKHLMSFLEKERRDKFLNIADEDWLEQPVYQIPFFEFYDALCEDSKVIASIVLEDPHKFLEVPGKMARGLVVLHLVKQMGWTWQRTRDGIRNIKKELI